MSEYEEMMGADYCEHKIGATLTAEEILNLGRRPSNNSGKALSDNSVESGKNVYDNKAYEGKVMLDYIRLG